MLIYLLKNYKFQTQDVTVIPCLKDWVYSQNSGSCYRQIPFESYYNFIETREFCKSFSNSSDLLYLDEENEEDELYLAFWQFQDELSWIGVEIENGALKWLSGRQVSELPKLQISGNFKNSLCVALKREDNYGKLVNITCDQKLSSAMCKMKGPICSPISFENASVSSNKAYYGIVQDVRCKEGLIFRDHSESKQIVCLYNEVTTTLEWSGRENISCIPNSCATTEEIKMVFPTNTFRENYLIGEKLTLKCPNGYVINVKCIFANNSAIAEWNYNPNCNYLCPDEWIYGRKTGYCISPPITQETSFLGARFRCSMFSYEKSDLATKSGIMDLYNNVNLASSNTFDFERKLWFGFDNESDMNAKLINKKDYTIQAAGAALCPVLSIPNGSLEIGFDNCSNLNVFYCMLRAIRCPELNRSLLDEMNIDFESWFDGISWLEIDNVVGNHTVTCRSLFDYRIPFHILEDKDLQSTFKNIHTEATVQNLLFFSNQKLNCEYNNDGAIPEWSYSDLNACERRSCIVPEEMMNSTKLIFTLNDSTLWEGTPNQSTPITVPSQTYANYTCANGKEIRNFCYERTYLYDVYWESSCNSLIFCEGATDWYTRDGRCLSNPVISEDFSWVDANGRCNQTSKELPLPDSLYFLNETARRFLEWYSEENSLWLGFSTIQTNSIVYLANLSSILREFMHRHSIDKINELLVIESQSESLPELCLVMRIENSKWLLFFDYCNAKPNRVFICVYRSSQCEEMNLRNSIRSSNIFLNGSQLEFKCKHGYTRMESNKSKVTCLVKNQKLKWIGDLQDCEVNYCNFPDLDTGVSKVINRTYGFPPLNEAAVSGVFYENAIITIKCIHGFLVNGESIAKQKCKFNSSGIGRGKWVPEKIECQPVECPEPKTYLRIYNSNLTKIYIYMSILEGILLTEL